MPLYSILLALGNPTVNYFSLDLEGAEFAVLKTIPWDKVDIQVIQFNALQGIATNSDALIPISLQRNVVDRTLIFSTINYVRSKSLRFTPSS